jgi:hypothetical protein
VATLASTLVLATLLYGVGASDVTTYAAVVLLLGVAAFWRVTSPRGGR